MVLQELREKLSEGVSALKGYATEAAGELRETIREKQQAQADEEEILSRLGKAAEEAKIEELAKMSVKTEKAVEQASVPEMAEAKIEASEPTRYEHGILRRIPFAGIVPEVNETRDQARSRRAALRTEQEAILKLRETENRIRNADMLEQAKIAQEQARVARLRG